MRLSKPPHRLTATLVSVLATALAAIAMVMPASPAVAQPACAMRMTVTTGADDLRPGSTFMAGLLVRQYDDQYQMVSLHMNGDFTFGDGGMRAYETRVFWVAPWGGASDGSGCPESRNIVGVFVLANLGLDFWGYDEWDRYRFTLEDSVNWVTYWSSAASTHFTSSSPRWQTTNPNLYAPWVPLY